MSIIRCMVYDVAPAHLDQLVLQAAQEGGYGMRGYWRVLRTSHAVLSHHLTEPADPIL